ncbi:unnamed protein product [Vicia faba]|uniref:Uncharacterized protein n=1 Tax=Vicia faba TaxID=3906 RepID=A0AAV1B0J9_VICFA|nr:unnamed protein product [Vicia faba]
MNKVLLKNAKDTNMLSLQSYSRFINHRPWIQVFHKIEIQIPPDSFKCSSLEFKKQGKLFIFTRHYIKKSYIKPMHNPKPNGYHFGASISTDSYLQLKLHASPSNVSIIFTCFLLTCPKPINHGHIPKQPCFNQLTQAHKNAMSMPCCKHRKRKVSKFTQ